MRTIVKRAEPHSLTEYRHSHGATYEDYPHKDVLRQCVVREQRGICCYCMAAIRPDRDGMRIEHGHCQADFPDQQLDYSNLLGACRGNEGGHAEEQHCDKRKGNRSLSRNPSNPLHRIEHMIGFRPDGEIFSTDASFDAELNEVLNLNLPLLKNRRKAALQAFQDTMGKRGLRPDRLGKWLRDWNGESSPGDLREYCQVVVYWLRKRLNRGTRND